MPFGFSFLHRLLGDVHTPHYFNEIALVGVAADKPTGADAKDNMLYYETDTGLWKRYRTALTSWVIVTSIAQIMGYDYTALMLRNVALDPETKALKIRSLVTAPPETYVLKAGDTMTGLLTLSGAPTTDLHAATKKYVDDFSITQGITFVIPGVAVVKTKATQVLIPGSLTTPKVIIYSDQAPTGASLIVDINKNGTTIFTTQANRPAIAVSGHYDESGTPNVTSFVKGDRVSVDIDQIGSSTPGGNDLLVTIIVE